MNELTVVSGKGGTGKTCLTASFAALMDDKIIADCDVDASNLHLLMDPTTIEEHEFLSGQTAEIDKAVCSDCGLCRNICRFGAVTGTDIDEAFCEGCGFCLRVCPAGAIRMRENVAGNWYVSKTRYGTLVHARLGIAQENSGKLVATVRKEAAERGKERGLDYLLVDGPPGIGCPVISSLTGSDMALIVTEPTMSGLHDLDRIVALCDHFEVPAGVCVNKFDINEENTEKIYRYCAERDVPVLGAVPYDTKMTEAMVQGVALVEFTYNDTATAIIDVLDTTLSVLHQTNYGKMKHGSD